MFRASTTSRAARLAAAYFAILFAALAFDDAHAVPPEAKSLFPAGVERGKTTEITANGVFQPWPVQVQVTGTGVRFEPTKTAGKFSVIVDAWADPGIRFVRFLNGDGVSAARPLVIDIAAEANEKEPNDDLTQATDARAEKDESPRVLNGTLSKGEKAADIDVFRVHLKKGATLVAALDANRTLGSPIDGVLQLVSASGFVLKQSNDELGLDPRLVYTAPQEADYYVRVFGFPAVGTSAIRFVGDEAGVYRLTLTTGTYIDFFYPPFPPSTLAAGMKPSGWNSLVIEPNSPPLIGTLDVPTALSDPEQYRSSNITIENAEESAAQAITAPAIVGGRIDKPGDRDTYSMQVTKGQAFQIRVISQELAFPVDPLLKIESADGTQLLRSDDGKRGEYDVDATYRAAADGEIRLVVEDLFGAGGERYVYLLDVRTAEPDFELSLAATELFTTAGAALEIPVTVERLQGLSADIEISLEGLPPECEKPIVVSSGKGDTSKKVTLKLTSPKPFTGLIRVVGRTIDPPPPAAEAEAKAKDGKPAAKPAKAPAKATVKETPKFRRIGVTKVAALPGASVDEILFVVGSAKKTASESAATEKKAEPAKK